ncbi:unnamed protein product [Citrullus colocynthis]|uniref:Uncharacterized protein n=1 Tax=Citrullus colocynthis TaxID=252529 RepID=A0ABP0YAU7_9ROSI
MTFMRASLGLAILGVRCCCHRASTSFRGCQQSGVIRQQDLAAGAALVDDLILVMSRWQNDGPQFVEEEDERDEWADDGLCLTGRGPDDSEEVSERLGVGASESRKVVSLGCGFDGTKEVSERMGLGRAMFLHRGPDGIEEVSERLGLARSVSLGRGFKGTEEVSERRGLARAVLLDCESIGRKESISRHLGLAYLASVHVMMKADQHESNESDGSAQQDYSGDMAVLIEKPLGDCPLGDLEEGEVEIAMQEGEGSQGGEGAFTMVGMEDDVLPLAIVDPVPSPLIMIEGIGDQEGGFRCFMDSQSGSVLTLLVWVGNWFTWTSKIHGLSILPRLDRVLVNEAWILSHPHSVVRAYHWGIWFFGYCCIIADSTSGGQFGAESSGPQAYSEGRFGRHISQLSEGVRAAKTDMDRA